MAGDSNRIISARQQFLNADGTVATPWFRFLEALATQTGGNFQLVFDESTDRASGDSIVAGLATEQGVEDAWKMAALAEYAQTPSEDALALANLPVDVQVSRETVTGSRAGNAALASLLTGLARQGTIQDASIP